MNKIIIILLSCMSLFANELFLYDANEKTELSEVIDNKLNLLSTTSGKTFTLSNGLSITTKTNDYANYVFPHKIAVNQLENTSVYFSQTQIVYENDFKLPDIVKVKDSLFNFTFDGEIYCVNATTNVYNIGTAMGFINIGKCKFFAKSGTKYTHVYVVEGTILVLDGKSSKKKQLKEGDYLVITPQVNLSPRSNVGISTGNSFSVKEVEDAEKEITFKILDKVLYMHSITYGWKPVEKGVANKYFWLEILETKA